MDRSAWCYVSGLVSSREGRLFAADFFRSLLACGTLQEAFLAVSDTPLKEAFPRASALADADAILSDLAHQEAAELRRLSPDPAVVDLILFQNEFYNVKGYLKAKVAGLPFAPIPNGRMTPEAVERLWSGLPGQYDAVFAEPIAQLHRLLGEEPKELPTLIDWVLDGAQLRWLLRQAHQLRMPPVAQYLQDSVWFQAIGMICRAQAAGVDLDRFRSIVLVAELNQTDLQEFCAGSEETQRQLLLRHLPPEAVEAILSGDQGTRAQRLQAHAQGLLLQRARQMKSVAFGPERVFGYLCSLQGQTHNLRLCLAGKANGIQPDLLRQRLWQGYA